MKELGLKAGDKINITQDKPLAYKKKPLDKSKVYVVTTNDIFTMQNYNDVQFDKNSIQPYFPLPIEPSVEQKIAELEAQLKPLVQKMEQELAGEVVPNIWEVKNEFVKIHNEIRRLQGKEPRTTTLL